MRYIRWPWRRPACRNSSHSDAASLENGVRKRHFLHRFEKFERGKIRPFFTPFCSLLGYGIFFVVRWCSTAELSLMPIEYD